MPDKHYVYSARTTREGLELLIRARGGKGWDAFVNEAVCGRYGLDPAIVNPPPSMFLAEREERRKAKETEKAKKPAKGKAKAKPGKVVKKAAKEATESRPA
jgi:hypothetical protein